MKKSEPKMILNISLNSEEIEEKVKIAMDEYAEKVIYKNLDEEITKLLTEELKNLRLLQAGVVTGKYRVFLLSSL